ncbi:TniQ family protein [Variovorax sp. RB3P1]|uniref:TniQ family protein n=1 Tax=Variovorax sp. RB3P1 TaxID=3443732 RepID=UPI003F470496
MSKQAYTPFSLLYREPKNPGESNHGYFVRLAEQNALEGVQELASVFNVRLSDLLRTDQDAFQHALRGLIAWDVFAKPNSRKPISSFTRVCAECLSQDEKPFIREEWERPLSIVCASHNCLLTDYCAQCNSRLRWNRKSILRCTCGSPIAKNENPIPKWWPNVQVAFGSDRFDSDHMSVVQDEIKCAARFLNWLGRQERERRDVFAGDLALNPEDNLFSTRELSYIERWFEDWPESFRRGVVNLPDRTKLARLYHWRKILCFASFRAIFESIRETRNSADTVSLLEAPLQIPGVGLQTLWLWQEIGILPAAPTIRSFKLRGIRAESREIAARLEDIWSTTMTLNDAAWFFGASDWIISLLAEASSLRILPSRFSAGACRVNTDEMIRVAISILSRAIPRRWDASPLQKTSIETLLYRIREHGVVSEYLKFVDLQGLSIYREPGASRLDRVFVERDGLHVWLAQVASTEKSHRAREPIGTRDRVSIQEHSSNEARGLERPVGVEAVGQLGEHRGLLAVPAVPAGAQEGRAGQPPSKRALSPQEAWPFPTPKARS